MQNDMVYWKMSDGALRWIIDPLSGKSFSCLFSTPTFMRTLRIKLPNCRQSQSPAWKMRHNCSRSLPPGNKAWSDGERISAKVQPIAHKSTPEQACKCHITTEFTETAPDRFKWFKSKMEMLHAMRHLASRWQNRRAFQALYTNECKHPWSSAGHHADHCQTCWRYPQCAHCPWADVGSAKTSHGSGNGRCFKPKTGEISPK